MTISSQISKHFKEIHFGGNWTCSNLREHLQDVTWQEAVYVIPGCNTIATLTYHLSYYVSAVLRVLKGHALDSSDKLSFNTPVISSQKDWEELLEKFWAEAEEFARLTEEIPDSRLGEAFTEEKYGSFYRNLHGIIEHSHYHLGQIVLLKKMQRTVLTS